MLESYGCCNFIPFRLNLFNCFKSLNNYYKHNNNNIATLTDMKMWMLQCKTQKYSAKQLIINISIYISIQINKQQKTIATTTTATTEMQSIVSMSIWHIFHSFVLIILSKFLSHSVDFVDELYEHYNDRPTHWRTFCCESGSQWAILFKVEICIWTTHS